MFFQELEIPPPDYHLGIGSGSHGQQTGQMLQAIEQVLLTEKPDWVLVYGDTNSTLAGALAAVKLHIPIAHVEAGLRSFNRQMPEEINRVLTDHSADLLFTPTATAVNHLHNEGIPAQKIHQVGDVMYDAALYYGQKASRQAKILSQLPITPKNYILVTIHRAENTDDRQRLTAIFEALTAIAPTHPVVIPLHPRTRKYLAEYDLLNSVTQVLITLDPIGYLEMVSLEKNARLIVTDSGGIQKEAYFYQVPCLTLREETEWTELIELGWNQLSPPLNSAVILETLHHCLASPHPPVTDQTPYGNGHSAEQICQCLIKSGK